MNQGPEDPTDELGSETGPSSDAAALRCGAPPVGQNAGPTDRYSSACSGLALVGTAPLEETTRVRTMLGLNAPTIPPSARVSPPSAQHQARR